MTDLAANEQQVAAQLIERLLTDPAFRARFRRDPAKACRDAGLTELAQEMSLGGGSAMMTLEVRESKSSLAGVMMAAAMEGVGVYEFTKHVVPQLEDAAGAIGGVLSHVSLPAIQDVFGGGGGAIGAAAVGPSGLPLGVEEPDGADGAAAAAGAPPAPAPEPPPAVSPEAAAAGKAPEAPEGGEAPGHEEDHEHEEEASEAAHEIAEAASADADLPSSTELPDAGSVADSDLPTGELAEGEESHHEGGHAHEEDEDAHGHAHPAPAPAPVQTPEMAAAGIEAPPPDAEQYGVGGKGGKISPEAKAALEHPNITLDENGKADIESGRMDPRVAAVLLKLAQEHKITVTATSSDHPSASMGGGSNHFYGRAVDIGTVDGEIVRPGSPAAREVAAAIAAIQGTVRPTEVGTPFQIAEEGFFTDGNHQDHIHAAFDDPITPDWEPPPDVQAMLGGGGGGGGGGSAGGASAAGAPGTPGPPVRTGNASGAFLAVDPKAAAASAGGAAARATGSFLAVEQPRTAAPPADAATAPPAEPDALTGLGGPDEYPGDDAPKEQIALWMATRAEKAGLPPELPVMAALVESNMENLDHGHASSVGYFQMLTTIWDTGKYEGYLEDPEKQMQWFIDTAGPLKARFGDLPPTAENLGTWVADTERPAAEYRGRYALRFEEARQLIEAGKERYGSGGGQAPASPGAPADAAPAAPAPETTAASRPPDPSEYGLDGTGGKPTPEVEALLANDKITFDEVGRADLKAGKIDPRVVAVLTKLSEDHEITVTCMCSDHSRSTASGNVSNHSLGRGVDIGTIDGELVRPDSPAARELAAAMQEIDPAYRPDEVGTPFSIAADGYFTDAAHQDHIHLGFKTEIPSDWTPPPDVAAGGAPAGGAATSAAPGAPASPAPAEPTGPATGRFLAVEQPKAGAASAADGDGGARRTGSFLAVDERTRPVGPASSLADPATAPGGATDAAAASAAGGSPLGSSALAVAAGELGVKEAGYNTGVDVDKYLASAGVAPGNPWCAAFVTWALEESGRKMEGGGWAAVQTWVRAAEAGTNDLSVVSAEDARPGDLVVYDWGGQDDFGSDGHIGFLASQVEGGKFTAVEGNYQDAVLKVARTTSGANVKFLRIEGAASGTAPAPPVDLGGPVMAGVEGSDVRAGAAGTVQPEPAGQSQPAPAPPADAGGGAPAASAAEGYPGDDASKADLAAWMGKLAEERGLPPELPVMAGLVESGLRNVNYGDADSVGFFQMRVGIWNRGDYAGYPENPELQVKWFLDQAEAVKEQRAAAGLPIDDPKQYGEWVADVERPAEQYRYKYQTRLAEAQNLLKQGGASSSGTPEAVAEPKEPKGPRTGRFLAVDKAVAEAASAAADEQQTGRFLQAISPEAAKAHAAGASPEEVAAGAASAPAPSPPAPPDPGATGSPGGLAGAEATFDLDGSMDYPGDDASQKEIAKWMARHAKAAGLPPELPVMAALVESNLQNLDHGHASSVGYFQMLTEFWDTGKYKGYLHDPRKQIQWFVDHALAEKRARLSRGAPIDDPRQYGEWIADVEKPAAEYRGRYQLRLEEARKLLR